jgi:hypothetical protein
MRFDRSNSAPQRGQPATLKACRVRQALSPIAQVVEKGDHGLKSDRNPANVG